MFSEIALVAARLGQFLQFLKTRVILILNFTQPHAITNTNSQCLSVFYIVTTGSNLHGCIPHLYLQVALVYQGDDPINFMTSFYGCLIAGIIPVPIEPPTDKDVSRILANTY